MKTKLKFFLLLTVISSALTGCVKLWEDDCKTCRSLPAEVELPVEPPPWETPETDIID